MQGNKYIDAWKQLTKHSNTISRPAMTYKPNSDQHTVGLLEQKVKHVTLGCPSNLPNCGMVAIAYIADKPVPKVTADFKRRHNRRGNWKGRSYTHEQDDMLKYYGVNYKDIKNKFATVGKWARLEAKRDTVYRVTVSGHVFVVHNGNVIDQNGVEPVARSAENRRRIKLIIEIMG
jgi:hypothetical protein